MYDSIHERENEEITLAKANQNITNTLCGYSSIYSNQPQEQKSQSNATSNFQSVIHDENGLYRKIKSSHGVSANGFTIIEKKFSTHRLPPED